MFYICNAFIGDSHSAAPVPSSTVKTEPQMERPSQPCRLNGLPPVKAAAVKNISEDTNSQSLTSVGRCTSVTALPAGDLLLGPRRSGHCTDRWAITACKIVHMYIILVLVA